MDQTRRKSMMVLRAHMVAKYLNEAGIEASLGFLSVNAIGFRMNTARPRLDDVVEHFFMKWKDVVNVQICSEGSSRTITILFEPKEFPDPEE